MVVVLRAASPLVVLRGAPNGISSRARPLGRMHLFEATTEAELVVARSLIEEYAASLEIDLSFQGFREEVARFPGDYAPPGGAVLLAYEEGEPSGVVALRPHGEATCEMKRLYVRPKFRGRGVGKALSEALVRKAELLGYRKMRLDTLPTMDAAIGLYRSMGFREIPPYRFNPVPGAHFMELDLGAPSGEAVR